MPPELIQERHRLAALAAWFADGGMEALVLGCTHFPYFKEALAARTGLPLVDPAEEMLRLLTQSKKADRGFPRSALFGVGKDHRRRRGAVRRPGSAGERGGALPAAPAAVQGRGAAVKAPLQAHLDGHHQQHQHDQHQPGCKGQGGEREKNAP